MKHMARFRLMYLGSNDERFIVAETMIQALQYAARKDVKGQNAFGDTYFWGTVDRIEVWDSDASQRNITDDEVAA